MILLKKFIFAPFFLIVLSILIYQLNPFFKSYEFIFSLSFNSLIQLVVLALLILLSSFLFVLFAFFAFDWKIVLAVGLLASLIPMLMVHPSLGLILSVGILAALLLSYLSVESTLKNYLTFNPNSLFGPHIKHLASLLILVIPLTYFLSISQVIQKQGFEIPDSLIETSLKLVPQSQQAAPQNLITDILKQTLKDQLNNLIKPYLGIIPAILAVLLFLILQSLLSILNLLIYPFLWIIFYILEKTGFVKFTEEQRPVKKMVI